MKHSSKDWLTATRYWSFSMSAMPAVVTFLYLCSKQYIEICSTSIINFLLLIISIIFLHAAGNLLSDYIDYKSSIKKKKAISEENLILGVFKPSEYIKLSIILFVVGLLIYSFIIVQTDKLLLIVSYCCLILIDILSVIKRNTEDNLVFFIIFTLATTVLTIFTVPGNLKPEGVILGIPIGLIPATVVYANNMRDEIQMVKKTKSKSSLVANGKKTFLFNIILDILIPFACIIIFVLAKLISPFCLISLLAAYPVYKATISIYNLDKKEHIPENEIEQITAKLTLIFTTLLSIGLLVEIIIA